MGHCLEALWDHWCGPGLRPPGRRRQVGGEQPGRDLRHGFVSLLSDGGVPLEEISREQIRLVIRTGATGMDDLHSQDAEA